MTHNITINGTNRSGVIKRLNFDFAESAYLGEVGQGRIVLEDEVGTIVVPGFKFIHANETDSTPPRIFTGFSHRKGIRRGVFRTGASREYEITTLDGNDLLRRRIMRGTDAKRPKETITQRTNWLVNQELSLVDVFDFGRVDSSSVKVDKADHRGQYPVDVLSALAKTVTWNFYVRWNPDESEWELVFRDEDNEEDTCTLAISNDLAEIDGVTTFEPFLDAELSQDPEHVYSGTYGTGAKGHVYETKPSTADDFTHRDGVTEDSGIRSDSTLSRDAKRFLNNSDTEEQLLTVTIQVPREKVGLVQAGQRISTRMTHMEPEGWDPAVFPRILRLRRSQPTNTDDWYNLKLDLSSPTPGGGGGACPYEATEAQTFYPLGCTHTDDPGFCWGLSDGVVSYLKPGIGWPVVPSPGSLGTFHFAVYGSGGPGTIDWAGDCVQSNLQFIVIGPGTLSVQTEIWEGAPRSMSGSWGESPDAYAHSIDPFTSGDIAVFEITGECINIVRLYDGPDYVCGGKWGWSAAEWEPA